MATYGLRRASPRLQFRIVMRRPSRGTKRSGRSHLGGSHEYPRPQFRREQWTSLNGKWDFAIDADAAWTAPAHVKFDATIAVPFSSETRASGIGETGFFKAVWYRRRFDVSRDLGDRRVIVHF